MKQKTLEFDYVADYNIGGISTIELFSGLDHAGEVSKAFVDEFKYLESVSSEIIIKINSSGGSVVSGMNIVTTILDCKIPTTSRIVGVAASMASVIALATDKTYIMDYALYMAHNPFSPTGEAQDDQLAHFAGMLRVIYAKRLGMNEDDVEAFMDGDIGTGTWYNAKKAEEVFGFGVEETGIQKSLEENLSELGQTFASEDIVNELHAIAANITLKEDKKTIKDSQQINPLNDTEEIVAATEVKKVSKKQNNSMKLDEISAALNIEDATVEAIEARVKVIVANNASLEESVASKNEELVAANKALSEKGVELATVSAELETAKTATSDVEAKVAGYEAKIAEFEASALKAHEAKIEGIVNDAADAGKITTEAKATWTGLLEASFESASAALEGLKPASAGKVKLSEQVSASAEEKKEVVEEVKKEVEANLPSMSSLMREIDTKNKSKK